VIDFTAGSADGDLSVAWMHGQPRGATTADPPLQVHHYDRHTVILRQSKQLTYEAPFLYLLFGNHTALLLDTGAVKDAQRMPLRATVDGLIDTWLAENPRETYRLVVAHTHGHADHVDGDEQFADRPNTTVVGKSVASVAGFFGFHAWPRETVEFDLGGRVLEVTGNPGHHAAAIAIYDAWSELLLTGDTVYPGRLYVNDLPAFVDSLDALVEITESRSVRWVVGCHIEMTSTPRVDYPIGTRYQPDEPRLEMTVDQLRAVRDSAHAVVGRPGVHVFDDFAIFNGRCVAGMISQLVRANRDRVRNLVR
jgi:glyoxylase-like metal-dependent hydrolase (beta-lactamase superfamily II)